MHVYIYKYNLLIPFCFAPVYVCLELIAHAWRKRVFLIAAIIRLYASSRGGHTFWNFSSSSLCGLCLGNNIGDISLVHLRYRV